MVINIRLKIYLIMLNNDTFIMKIVGKLKSAAFGYFVVTQGEVVFI